jgi:hypothetical protein
LLKITWDRYFDFGDFSLIFGESSMCIIFILKYYLKLKVKTLTPKNLGYSREKNRFTYFNYKFIYITFFSSLLSGLLNYLIWFWVNFVWFQPSSNLINAKIELWFSLSNSTLIQLRLYITYADCWIKYTVYSSRIIKKHFFF